MDRTLFEAAESGDLIGINATKNLDQLLTPDEHNTVLHVAVWFDNKPFAEQALKQCPNLLLKRNKRGETPLHAAAKKRDPGMSRLLLDFASSGDKESQQSINCGCARALLRVGSEARGDTALHVGVRHGHFEVAKVLIDADVEMLETLNGANESPLFLAVEGRFLDIARYIINKRCGVFGQHFFDGSNGMNALHAAVIRTHRARILENRVPDLSLERLRHMIRSFLLHIEEYFGSFSHKRETDIMELLLRGEENIRARLLEKQEKRLNWTPLHFAASLGHLEATKLILAQSCCSVAYLRDKEGLSSLHIAARDGHVRVMKEIISHTPEASDLADKRGWTALHVAVAYQRLGVVKYILDTRRLEFLLNVADKEGNTALHLAVGRRSLLVMNALVDDVRVDKRATNLKHLKPVDILRTNPDIGELFRSWFIKKLERQGGQESLQSIMLRVEQYSNQVTHTADADIANPDSQPTNDNKKGAVVVDDSDKSSRSARLKKISDTHILVAALIASVTFTAGFTIPGGFVGPGTAALADRQFFKVFVVANALAFFCASASLLLLFISSIEHNYHLLLRFTRLEAILTYVSVLGMVVAFTSGLRVVMPASSMLAVYTLAMGGLFVFLFIIGCL